MSPRPLPRWFAPAATRAGLFAGASLIAFAAPLDAVAQDLVPYHTSTQFDRLPDEGGDWSRVGNGVAFLAPDGQGLVVNDNSPGDYIAFQTLLGSIEAGHRVVVDARVQVLSNLGGEAVLVELSRPGLELVVELGLERVDVFERTGERGGRGLRWIAGAFADLREPASLRITKSSIDEDPSETLFVEVDGIEVVRAVGRGDGDLGVGRVLFGSLGSGDVGASVWEWMDVEAVPVRAGGVATEASSLGGLKARYRR